MMAAIGNWQLIFSIENDDCGRYSTNTANTACERDGFPRAKLNLTPYKSDSCQFRFRYHDGNDWAFYAAIDNVLVESVDSLDIGVIAVQTQNEACLLGNNETVEFVIKNYGFYTARNFEIHVNFNNGTNFITETIIDSLLPNDSLVYSLNTPLNLSTIGTYNIIASTLLLGDTLNNNDTLITTIKNNNAVLLPYQEGFEGSNHQWFVSGDSASWEVGIPTGNIINKASEGNRAFVTNLNGNYKLNEKSYLNSPIIFKEDSIDFLLFAFDLFYETEFTFDQISFQYSTDLGLSWTNIPNSNLAENWYVNGQNFWSGSSKKWVSVKNIASGLKGSTCIQFRVALNADNLNNYEGIGFDNFSIQRPDDFNLELLSVLNPFPITNGCNIIDTNISIQILNLGLNEVDSFSINYQVNNFPVVTELVKNPIPSKDIVNLSFKKGFDFSGLDSIFLSCWISLSADTNKANDSIVNQSYSPIEYSTYTLPFYENFDSFYSGQQHSIYDDSLTNNWTRTPEYNRMNPYEDPFTWGVFSNPSPEFDVSMTEDFTGRGGNFMMSYSEFGVDQGQKSISLQTPCISLKSAINPTLSFNYGVPKSYLYIDILVDNKWITNIDRIATGVSLPPNAPYNKSVNLSAYKGKDIKIRFSMYGGSNNNISIDDVVIHEPISQDARMLRITPIDNSTVLSDSTHILVEVQNFGSQSISSGDLNLFYQIDNQSPVSDTSRIDIPNGLKRALSFSEFAKLGEYGRTYQIKSWVTLSGDTNTIYDTAYYQFTNKIKTLPYKEGFDSFETQSCELASNSSDVLKDDWKIVSSNLNWKVVDIPHCFGEHRIQIDTLPNSHSKNFIILQSTQVSRPKLLSPYIDLGNAANPHVRFKYHNNGQHPLSKALYYINVVDGFTTSRVGAVSRTQNSSKEAWGDIDVHLRRFKNKKIRLEFSPINITYRDAYIAIDEFKVYNKITYDLSLEDLILPESSCELSNSESVSIWIKNFGDSTIVKDSLTAHLFVNGALIASEIISDSLAKDSSLKYTFNNNINLSGINQEYTVRVELEHSNDSNIYDNSLENTVSNYAQAIGYFEDFESFDRGLYHLDDATQINSSGQSGMDILKNGWEANPSSYYFGEHWNVQDPSNEDFSSTQGGTRSENTGPLNDHSESGHTFLYYEASTSVLALRDAMMDTSALSFSCIDLSNSSNPYLQFWYHKYGDQMGDLFIDIHADGQWNYDIDSIIGETQELARFPWLKKQIDLSQFINKTIKIQFRTMAGHFESDMAIDDVYIFDSIPVVTSINEKQSIFDDEQEILLYPNPNNGIFNLKISSSLIGSNYSVLDLNGRQIENGRLTKNLNQLDLSSYQKGIYIVHFPEMGSSKKVVIQ